MFLAEGTAYVKAQRLGPLRITESSLIYLDVGNECGRNPIALGSLPWEQIQSVNEY